MFVECCVCALVIINRVTAFSHGAPDYSCKDPSTFHTKKINATHEGIIMPEDIMATPYSIVVGAKIFRPGDRVTVTLQSNDAQKPIRGFFLQATQAGVHLQDLRRRPFGKFENTSTDEHPSVCQSFRSSQTTGITHSNNKGKPSVSVTWLAPLEYNPGEIQFLATGVLDYATYWTNIRSERIVPEGYTEKIGNGLRGYTPTAAWYRWLQYLRQQRLQNQDLKTTYEKKEAVHDHSGHSHSHDHSEAGHIHSGTDNAHSGAGRDHHHHYDHVHDHAHSAVESVIKDMQAPSGIQTTPVTLNTTKV